MIRKLIKRLGILLGVVILIPLILLVIGSFLVPRDKIKEEAARQLATATGAEVTLGDASVRIWPKLAVRLAGGSISGTGPALAAATGSANELTDFQIQLSNLDVQVGLRPLLRKQIEVDSIKITGPALAAAWDEGEVLAEEFELEITDLELPMESVQAVAGATGGDLPPGEVIPEDLALVFSGKIERLIVQDVPYDVVEFAGDLDFLILTVDTLLGKRSSGTITGSGEIDYERDPWGELDFSVQALDVPAGDLLLPWVPDLAKRLTGNLDAEVSGNCNLRDDETILSTLSVNGELGCGEGALVADDWLRDISPYLGNRQDLKTIKFSELNHVFRVDEGKYHVEELHIDGLETDWFGNGWIGLDGTIDANVRVKLPGGFTPDLGQWSFLADTLRDEDGRVNLDLHLTGMVARPGVGLNLASLQGGVTSGANDAVKKGLGGLLDKLKTR